MGRQTQISLLGPCSAVVPAFAFAPGLPPVPHVLELLHLERQTTVWQHLPMRPDSKEVSRWRMKMDFGDRLVRMLSGH